MCLGRAEGDEASMAKVGDDRARFIIIVSTPHKLDICNFHTKSPDTTDFAILQIASLPVAEDKSNEG